MALRPSDNQRKHKSRYSLLPLNALPRLISNCASQPRDVCKRRARAPQNVAAETGAWSPPHIMRVERLQLGRVAIIVGLRDSSANPANPKAARLIGLSPPAWNFKMDNCAGVLRPRQSSDYPLRSEGDLDTIPSGNDTRYSSFDNTCAVSSTRS